MEVSQRITRLQPRKKLWIVADKYPVWLVTAVALGLPLEKVQAPVGFREEFPEARGVWHGVNEDIAVIPPPDTLILGSGSQSFLESLRAKLRHHTGGFIFSLYALSRPSVPLVAATRKQRSAVLQRARNLGRRLDLRLAVLDHAAFGGATNGHHCVFYDSESGCTAETFVPGPATPKTMAHLVGSASRGFFPQASGRPHAGACRRTMAWQAHLERSHGHVGARGSLRVSVRIQLHALRATPTHDGGNHDGLGPANATPTGTDDDSG